jgi:hypothetical protein
MYVYYTVLLVLGDLLCSSRGNLKNVCVCIAYARSSAHSGETQIMFIYVYYTVVLVLGDPLHSNVGTSFTCVLNIPYAIPWYWILCSVVSFHETPTFGLVTSLASWWRHVNSNVGVWQDWQCWSIGMISNISITLQNLPLTLHIRSSYSG